MIFCRNTLRASFCPYMLDSLSPRVCLYPAHPLREGRVFSELNFGGLHIWYGFQSGQLKDRFRASSAGAAPSNYLDLKNMSLFPLPTEIDVQTLKREVSNFSQGTSMPILGRSSSCHSYHFHLSRKAPLKIFKSKFPNPPRDLRRHTYFQLTRQTSFAASFDF